MRQIPLLETERLTIRPFVLADVKPFERISRLAFGYADPNAPISDLNWRMHTWRVLNEEMLGHLYQPPYGDRAIISRTSGELIGAVGLVPYIDAFNVMPGLRFLPNDDGSVPRATAEVGLFWAIDPAHQRKGYASEAAQALIDYAFNEMHLVRIIATTEFENTASQAVMRKLGMRLERNESNQPPWLQVVGVLENT